MVGGSLRPRIRLVVALLIAASLGLVGLVGAQQTEIALDDGDGVTLNCPTELSVEMSDQAATATCAAEQSDAAEAPPSPDVATEQ